MIQLLIYLGFTAQEPGLTCVLQIRGVGRPDTGAVPESISFAAEKGIDSRIICCLDSWEKAGTEISSRNIDPGSIGVVKSIVIDIVIEEVGGRFHLAADRIRYVSADLSGTHIDIESNQNDSENHESQENRPGDFFLFSLFFLFRQGDGSSG